MEIMVIDNHRKYCVKNRNYSGKNNYGIKLIGDRILSNVKIKKLLVKGG